MGRRGFIHFGEEGLAYLGLLRRPLIRRGIPPGQIFPPCRHLTFGRRHVQSYLGIHFRHELRHPAPQDGSIYERFTSLRWKMVWRSNP